MAKESATLFADRVAAGWRLAGRLNYLRGEPVVVLGLPRGGVPVAEQVARALNAPLDVLMVRKLGVPFQPELGMGAIGEDGIRVLNEDVVRMARVPSRDVAAVEKRERAELERRALLYRDGRPRLSLKDKVAVIVDDGIATGSTARAACRIARAAGAGRVVIAVPVAPSVAAADFDEDADDFVALQTPLGFVAVGQFYADFSPVTDGEVVTCLERANRAARPLGSGALPDDSPVRDEDVIVRAGAVRLPGHLTVPERPAGIVLFAHGSGSSRHSPRNRYVATILNDAGLGTLLFDLLTSEEELDRTNVFDIELLAGRLLDAARWVSTRMDVHDLPVGYFGASTGAAAALWAAADAGVGVAAVVSRGGRPDLAASRLDQVRAPTLLIVGGADDVVLDLNRRAQTALRCDSRLTVIPGATHLFEEPGTLHAAAKAARDWFCDHLKVE